MRAHGEGAAADASMTFATTALDKGPAHDLPLPAPGEQAFRSGRHFVAAVSGGGVRLSVDGSQWSDLLNIAERPIGPAACDGRCVVAAGRILLPPVVVSAP
jgi:hypothetical protein